MYISDVHVSMYYIINNNCDVCIQHFYHNKEVFPHYLIRSSVSTQIIISLTMMITIMIPLDIITLIQPLYNGWTFWVKKVALLYRGVLYVEVILYSKECNWYTRCCPLNGGVHYRECPLNGGVRYRECPLNGGVFHFYLILHFLEGL